MSETTTQIRPMTSHELHKAHETISGASVLVHGYMIGPQGDALDSSLNFDLCSTDEETRVAAIHRLLEASVELHRLAYHIGKEGRSVVGSQSSASA